MLNLLSFERYKIFLSTNRNHDHSKKGILYNPAGPYYHISTLFFRKYHNFNIYTMLHIFRQVLFWAGKQVNHQNFEKSLLSNKCWLISKFKMANSKKLSFSTPSIGPWVGKINWCEGHGCGSTYMVMRLIPMKISQHLLDSKDFSKFWWLPWFPAPNSTCLKICNTVYVRKNAFNMSGASSCYAYFGDFVHSLFALSSKD